MKTKTNDLVIFSVYFILFDDAVNQSIKKFLILELLVQNAVLSLLGNGTVFFIMYLMMI